MSHIVKFPDSVSSKDSVSVFLAGTIDNGDSVDWQSQVEAVLSAENVSIINPRRDEWDESWEKLMANPMFREQVEWELGSLESSTIIFLYFAPHSQSPVSLLELGLYAQSKKLIIVCPHGFWRLGNVEVVAARYDIPLYDSLALGLKALKEQILKVKAIA